MSSPWSAQPFVPAGHAFNPDEVVDFVPGGVASDDQPLQEQPWTVDDRLHEQTSHQQQHAPQMMMPPGGMLGSHQSSSSSPPSMDHHHHHQPPPPPQQQQIPQMMMPQPTMQMPLQHQHQQAHSHQPTKQQNTYARRLFPFAGGRGADAAAGSAMGSAAEGGIDVGAVPLEWTRWTRSTGSMSGMVGSVVGIIGTARDGAVSASSIANLIAGCNAFNGGAPDQHAERAGAGSGSSHANGSAGFGDGGSAASAPGAAAADSQVESYYNAKRATLYLNLVCDYEDIVDLASQAGIEVGEISSEMSQAWLEQQDDQMIQKIAFMFSVCHEIVLVMPSTQFEPHWLTLLKVLEGSKKYIKFSAPRKPPMPKGSRPALPSPGHCVPTLRFVVRAPRRYRSTPGANPPLTNDQVKQLQNAVSAQTRRILANEKLFSLQKGREKTAKLFTIPPPKSGFADPFVLVHEPNRLVQDGVAAGTLDANEDKSYTLLQMFGALPSSITSSSGGNALAAAAAAPPKASTIVAAVPPCVSAMQEFYTDRCNSISSEFEQLRLDVWSNDAALLFKQLAAASAEARPGFAFDESSSNSALTESLTVSALLAESLTVKIDPMSSFSQRLCSRAWPVALAQYRSDLPKAYRRAEHVAALARAVKLFRSSACGPEFPQFLKTLVGECERIWISGRQLCEASSVFGTRCCMPANQPAAASGGGDGSAYHAGDADGGRDGVQQGVPCTAKGCTTGKTVVCTCLCGKVQKEVEEPFLLADANAYFVEEDCCVETVAASSIYKCTTADENVKKKKIQQQQQQQQWQSERSRTASTSGTSTLQEVPALKGEAPGYNPVSATPSTLFGESALAELLQAGGLGADLDGGAGGAAGSGTGEDHAAPRSSFLTPPSGGDSVYPAFKCCKIGTRADYGPSTGLKTAGFINGANYMLPWDVVVSSNKKTRKGGGGAKKANSVRTQQTERCYIGYEYECASGCRFMDSGPDRRVQKTASGYAKGTALSALRSDMPLFVACPDPKCARKRVFAQLARLHIVTPAAEHAVKFGLVPRIQLRAGRSSSTRALIAHTGSETIWFEPDGQYVVHLPRIFAHQDKAIILPVDVPAMRQNMCLLKNPFILFPLAV